jgi:hypothetical protein
LLARSVGKGKTEMSSELMNAVISSAPTPLCLSPDPKIAQAKTSDKLLQRGVFGILPIESGAFDRRLAAL